MFEDSASDGGDVVGGSGGQSESQVLQPSVGCGVGCEVGFLLLPPPQLQQASLAVRAPCT